MIRAKVYISYRRMDSEVVAVRIYQYIAAYLGTDHVYDSNSAIPSGVDVHVYLLDQIAKSDIALVIIGPIWAKIMQENADKDDGCAGFIRPVYWSEPMPALPPPELQHLNFR